MKYSSNKDFQVYIASLVASKKWTYKKNKRGRHASLLHINGQKLPVPSSPGDYRAFEISRQESGILPGKNKP